MDTDIFVIKYEEASSDEERKVLVNEIIKYYQDNKNAFVAEFLKAEMASHKLTKKDGDVFEDEVGKIIDELPAHLQELLLSVKQLADKNRTSTLPTIEKENYVLNMLGLYEYHYEAEDEETIELNQLILNSLILIWKDKNMDEFVSDYKFVNDIRRILKHKDLRAFNKSIYDTEIEMFKSVLDPEWPYRDRLIASHEEYTENIKIPKNVETSFQRAVVELLRTEPEKMTHDSIRVSMETNLTNFYGEDSQGQDSQGEESQEEESQGEDSQGEESQGEESQGENPTLDELRSWADVMEWFLYDRVSGHIQRWGLITV